MKSVLIQIGGKMRRDAEVKIKGTFIVEDKNKIDLHEYWHYFNGGSE